MAMLRGIGFRTASGERFLQELVSDLKILGFTVALNGTEHTHASFVNRLRQSTDSVSLFIRFEPDGVICMGNPPKSWYIEAKSNISPKRITLEKTAYEQYIKRTALGQIVAIVFDVSGKRLWNLVDNIKFIDSQEYVQQYRHPFPVIDGWITPRQSDYWMNTARWNNPQASGTSYKVVDLKSLLLWQEFLKVFNS
jgi:hypothetical protein